jgi:hypothetical protein
VDFLQTFMEQNLEADQMLIKKRYLFGLASLTSNSQKKIIYTSPNDRDELTDF